MFTFDFCLIFHGQIHTLVSITEKIKYWWALDAELLQVATKGYSKVLTDSALQVNFFIHLHFFLKNAKTKVLSRPKPSVNMLRIHSGNTDGVNTSEIIIVTLRDLMKSNENLFIFAKLLFAHGNCWKLPWKVSWKVVFGSRVLQLWTFWAKYC